MFTNLIAGTTEQAAGWQCVCAGCAELQAQGQVAPGTQVASVATAGRVDEGAALISGSRWSSGPGERTVITYSFSKPGSRFDVAEAAFSATVSEFSAADKRTTRSLLDSIQAVCNVKFVEVPDTGSAGVLRYGYSQRPNEMGFAGYAFFPAASEVGGDIWIGKDQAAAVWDYYRPNLILHETLHAIGLKHPFDGQAVLSEARDTVANTVMSYSAIAGSRVGGLSHYPAEPMALDILALQALYGSAQHQQGNTVYDVSGAGFSGLRALWDTGGTDLLDASRCTEGVRLDLTPGGRSDVGAEVRAVGYFGGVAREMTYRDTLAIAPGVVIEDATGSAFADFLKGNAAANVLCGGCGDDLIDGGAGQDTAAFAGSLANFRIDKVGGTLRVTDRTGKEGTDTLAGIEKLRFQDMTVDLTVKDAAAAVADARLQAVVELYVGFFNRVPDAEGLGFWLEQMNAGMSTATVAEHFYGAAQAHGGLTGYSAGMSDADFVRIIYKNVLGRSSVDADGLAYWSGALGNGTETRGSLLESILQSAHTFKGHAEYGFVANLLENKFTVGKTFAVDMGLTWNSAELSIEKGMQIAAAVTPVDIGQALQLIGVAPQDLGLLG
ncbi:MAG TPA: DUF4214 domain-containing protein [Ramlibacter sp.]|nr:DUF4214 domain-containing protein [Ramlibacter sp.]